jgi:hypothetical protein
MTKTIGLILVGTCWLGLAGCQPDPEVETPVAEGLPQNESRPQERRVAEGVLREDRESEPTTTPRTSPQSPALEDPAATDQ